MKEMVGDVKQFTIGEKSTPPVSSPV